MLYRFGPAWVAAIICLSSLAGALPASAQVREGQFVVARDGHFYLGDERTRFWGINGGPCSYLDKAHIEAVAQRFRALGFNAVRPQIYLCQLHEQAPGGQGGFLPYTRGDGSVWDGLDYLLSCYRREGLYVYGCTEFGGLPLSPEAYSILPPDEHEQEWKQAVASLDLQCGINGLPFQLAYFDDRIAEIHLKHLRDILRHVNQYTGKPYAEDEMFAMWQVANETALYVFGRLWGDQGGLQELPEFFRSEILGLWNEFLREKYSTDARLVQAWGALEPGESLERGTVGLKPACWWGDPPTLQAGRYADVVQFGMKRWTGFTERAIATMRAQAPEGVGINVVPIIAGANDWRALPVAWANSLGDAMACNDYHGMLTTDPSAPLYPWRSRLTEPPLVHPGMALALADKPFLSYEGNVHKPAPYRAEYPLASALWGCWQDYDGIFLHVAYPWQPDIAASLRAPILYAGTSVHKSIFDGDSIWSDELQCAIHRAAAAIFTRGYVLPAESPTILTVGRGALADPGLFLFGNRYWDECQHPPDLRWTQTVRGGGVRFDASWDGQTRLDGEVDERPAGPVTWGWSGDVVWDWQQGRVVVDVPECNAVAGFDLEGWEFRNGVTVEGFDRDFVVFVLTSEDGLPIETSRRLVCACMSTAENTGARFDPTKLVMRPVTYRGQVLDENASLLAMVTDPGHAPVDVSRVSYTVTLPHLAGRVCRKYDFLLNLLSETPAEDGFTLSGEEAVFFCEVVAE